MTSALSVYPETATERDRWIVERRGPRIPVQSNRPYAFLVEQELFESGVVGDVATIFLTNRECPWRCAMCDLWQHTLEHSVGPGAIVEQIRFALQVLPVARQIKLYNSGSFFDHAAIPPEDYEAIAALLRSFERIVVESHPALIGRETVRFHGMLGGEFEVAMGLETAHPGVLQRINKRMTLPQYAAAAKVLHAHGIALRSFVLVQPPFLDTHEALEWACRSIDFAQDCGATVVTLIPTRGGNGATEDLARAGQFSVPSMSVLECALAYGIRRRAGRVFLDLWDIERISCCAACKQQRIARLRTLNQTQVITPPVLCSGCDGEA